MQLTRIPTHCIAPRLDRFAGKATLLVDPDPVLLEAKKLLLSGSCSSVHTARTPVEVFNMQPEDEPQIAVFSDALGSFQLEAVAEYVRHRWPRARILVVGQAAPYLNDQLYDETVTADFNPTEMHTAVQSRSHNPY